jgi:hypothetical protein
LPLDEYRKRLYERKAAERLLQEPIEGALDINAPQYGNSRQRPRIVESERARYWLS